MTPMKENRKLQATSSPSPEGEQMGVLFYPRHPRNPWLRQFVSVQTDKLNAS
jgi:hypothetical protein